MVETVDETVDVTVKGDGDYYCPGCGRRYDTPGVCTGWPEAGHPEILVERVEGEG